MERCSGPQSNNDLCRLPCRPDTPPAAASMLAGMLVGEVAWSCPRPGNERPWPAIVFRSMARLWCERGWELRRERTGEGGWSLLLLLLSRVMPWVLLLLFRFRP